MRILVLADSDTHIHSLHGAGSKITCDPIPVTRLSDGIDLIGKAAFDVLLVDLDLPDSQGLETFRVLYRLCPNTPIVLLVPPDEEEMGERALREGAQGYLIKGQVNPSALIHLLRSAIGRQEHLKKVQFQLRQLAAAREAVQEATRTRISRALHNDSEQLLIAIKMDLMAANSKLREPLSEEVKIAVEEKLLEAHKLADRAIDSIQKISIELRPSALDNLGLAEALEDEARRFEHRTEIGVDFESLESLPKLHRETATALFRVFQELLDNVINHAQASIVDVFLVVDGPDIELRVHDNGVGIAREPCGQGATGISWMRERALYLGGEIRYKGTPSEGTQVTVRVPIRLGLDNRL